jgi:hypothetical protein
MIAIVEQGILILYFMRRTVDSCTQSDEEFIFLKNIIYPILNIVSLNMKLFWV